MAQASTPCWNLNDLFSSPKDPKILKLLIKAKQKVLALRKTYRGKLTKLASEPAKLLNAIISYQAIIENIALPLEYAELRFADDCTDLKRAAFLEEMRKHQVDLEGELIWFELELGRISKTNLKLLSQSTKFKPYYHFVARAVELSVYRLNEEQERILEQRELTGRQAFLRLFEEELAHKKFYLAGQGKKALTETQVLHLLYSPKRNERKAGADALTVGLKEESRRLAFITNTLACDKAVEDKLRGYKYPEQSRHLDNQIPLEVVNSMVGQVQESYDLVRQYYSFKRQALGLKELYDYDRYAPLGTSAKHYDFKQAKELILTAFKAFSPEYENIAEKFFSKSWIEAQPRPGKRSGAFCSFGTPSTHPVVFMNFLGTARDVSTLAHELGHAIHGYLMAESGYLNYRVPLTLAETASVFAEILVFEQLLQEVKSKKERTLLLMQKIEDIIATVYRQVAMYLFEQDLHKTYRSSGQLNTEQINKLWIKRQQEMFGKSVQLRSEYEIWWSYIPHFLHTPFYVYAYSFGELLTLSLYSIYKNENSKADFVERYLNLLKAGSKAAPAEQLKAFGINLNQGAFWSNGIGLIRKLVEQLRMLS